MPTQITPKTEPTVKQQTKPSIEAANQHTLKSLLASKEATQTQTAPEATRKTI